MKNILTFTMLLAFATCICAGFHTVKGAVIWAVCFGISSWYLIREIGDTEDGTDNK